MTWHESRETIYFNRNHRQKISFSFLLPSLTIQARGLNNLVSRTTVCRGGGKMRRKGWKLRDKTRSGGVFFTRGGSTLSSKIMRCVSSGPWKSEPKGKERKKKKKTRDELELRIIWIPLNTLFILPSFSSRSLAMVFRYRLEFFPSFFPNKNLHLLYIRLCSQQCFQPAGENFW